MSEGYKKIDVNQMKSETFQRKTYFYTLNLISIMMTMYMRLKVVTIQEPLPKPTLT